MACSSLPSGPFVRATARVGGLTCTHTGQVARHRTCLRKDFITEYADFEPRMIGVLVSNRYVIALTQIHNRPIFGKVSLAAAERHSPIIAIATEMLSFAIVQKEN